MKKFTLIGSALLLGAMGFSAQAAEMSQAVETSGLGKYIVSAYGVYDVLSFEWQADGEAQTVTLVNPKEGTSEWDENETYQYVEVTMAYPGGTATLQATIGGGDDSGIGFATRAVDTPDSGTSLSINLGQDYSFDWPGGEYTLTIPAGIVENENGDTNPIQTVTWTCLASYVYPVITPADYGDSNQVVSSADLKEVKLTFDSAPVLTGMGELQYWDDNEGDYVNVSSDLISVSGNSIVIDLSGLAEGRYNFDLPSLFAVVGDAASASTNWTYVVWNGLPSGEIVSGPAPNGVYARNIQLTWNTEITPVSTLPAINVYENWYDETETPVFSIPAENVTIKEIPVGEGGEPSTDPDGVSSGSDTMWVLNLDMEAIFEGKTGNFIVVIPENIVQNGAGLKNPAQQIEFTLTALSPVEPSVDLSDEGVFTITWEGNEYTSTNDALEAYLVLPNGTRAPLAVAGYNWTTGQDEDGEIEIVDYTDVKIDLTSLLTEEGTYELLIPEAFFTLSMDDNVYINGEIAYTFDFNGSTTTGIEGIESEINVPVVYYNINGVRVNNPEMGQLVIKIQGNKASKVVIR